MQNLQNASRTKTLHRGIPCEHMAPFSKCEKEKKKPKTEQAEVYFAGH